VVDILDTELKEAVVRHGGKRIFSTIVKLPVKLLINVIDPLLMHRLDAIM